MMRVTAAIVLVLAACGAAAGQDAAEGEQAAKKCVACHDFTDGGPNRLGPPMFGIMGQPAASVPGFSYSQVLMEMRDAGLTWTPETMAPFLADTRKFAPGSKMAFAGIRNEAEIADLIAYLISISPSYTPETATTDLPQGGPSYTTRMR